MARNQQILNLYRDILGGETPSSRFISCESLRPLPGAEVF